jgi:16S rRNA (guanine527-N7)-methyltransferase
MLERFADLLAGPGVERGLIGPREVDRLWDRHLVNCGLLAEAIEADRLVCDLGSGAGLPGVVLAAMRPDLRVTLLEPLLRRTEFLAEVLAELGLSNARVVRSRAEDHEGRYDTVTARAVAPLDRLAAWALPLCRPGGEVLAIKGERAAEELAAIERTLPALGASAGEIHQYGVGLVTPALTVVRLVAADRSMRQAGAGASTVRRRGRRGK